MTAQDICIAALQEVNISDPVDAPQQADLSFVLGKLNRLLDNWNADRWAVYADQFLDFTITPNLNPHTIGLTANSPTWTVTGNRPESIEGMVLILTSGAPNARSYMRKRDAQWWEFNTVPTITSQTPTDFFYNPTWPNGSIYLYPVPTVAYDVQIWCRVILSQLTQFATFSLPPGYWDAITLTLAEDICESFEKQVPRTLPMRASKARSRVFSVNQRVPRLNLRDAGMPSGAGSGLPDFFWPTGRLVP